MRPITDVLRDIRRGRVVDDATDKLARDDPKQRELFTDAVEEARPKRPRAVADAAE